MTLQQISEEHDRIAELYNEAPPGPEADALHDQLCALEVAWCSHLERPIDEEAIADFLGDDDAE